jgi:ABC-2 type transport system ATP-binding protein
MINVHQLSKSYGDIRAIEGIDFEVSAGEVVGLLGPNGAGKTTTMRILCGCIGASSGEVTIDGQNVSDAPKWVKAQIGYLPEQPPLYETMVVRDYIEFAATIKGVSDPVAAAQKAILQVGLQADVGGRPAADRIIGHLSKGYKQRVGLAQALVHNPRVLVLDEPTSGLDPAQRKEIRDLLVDLAHSGSRTVILSTHVLTEIEAICDRVVIINNGKVVAQDTIDNLRMSGGRVRLQVERDPDQLIEALSQLETVETTEAQDHGVIIVSTSNDSRALIAEAAAPFGLLSIHQEEGLEEIYLRLTGSPE